MELLSDLYIKLQMSKLSVTQKHEILIALQKEREEKYNEY